MRVSIQDYDTMEHFLVACLASKIDEEKPVETSSLPDWEEELKKVVKESNTIVRYTNYCELLGTESTEKQAELFDLYKQELDELLADYTQAGKSLESITGFVVVDPLILGATTQATLFQWGLLKVANSLYERISAGQWANPYQDY